MPKRLSRKPICLQNELKKRTISDLYDNNDNINLQVLILILIIQQIIVDKGRVKKMKVICKEQTTLFMPVFNAMKWYINENESEIVYIVKGGINVDGVSYGSGDILFWKAGEIIAMEIESDTECIFMNTEKDLRIDVSKKKEIDIIELCAHKMDSLCKKYEKHGCGINVDMMKIDPKDISVVIQGYANDMTIQGIKSVRKHLPGSTIILSTWKECNCSEMDYDILVQSEDPGTVECSTNSRFSILNNGNRQIVSTKEGLKHAKKPFTLRMRSDMALLGDGITRYFGITEGRDNKYSIFSDRILIGELLTRKSWAFYTEGKWHSVMKPFHPSDWFMFGKTEDVKSYYEHVELIPPNEMAGYQCKNKERTKGYVYSWRYTTEQHLFLGSVRQKYPDLRFDDWTDWDDETVELSDKLMLNNFTILNLCQHQMVNLKKVEDSFANNGLTYLEKNLYTNDVYKEYIRKSLNQIHLFCPAGLGDTLIICGFINELKKMTGAEIVPIIKKSHESVMRLYGIKNYMIHGCSFDEVKGITDVSDKLEIGKVFLAHPAYWSGGDLFKELMKCRREFVDIYREMLGLRSEVQMELPSHWPKITPELEEKLMPMTISDIILVLPEMHARESDTVPIWFFEELVETLDSNGESVVVNMQYPNNNFSRFLIDLTLDELIALAIECKKVISVRSGLCDLIYNKVKQMEVIYSNRIFWRYYHFDGIFKDKRNEVTETIWEWNRFFKKEGVHSCAVYGMADIGQRIVDVLMEEGDVEIEFVIDRNKDSIETQFPIFHPDENWPEVDMIIVTPRKTGSKVKDWVSKKVKGKVVLYEELLRAVAFSRVM